MSLHFSKILVLLKDWVDVEAKGIQVLLFHYFYKALLEG